MDRGKKKPTIKTVISASRRTDIPAFYMDWFMQGIQKGFFEVENPYNHKTFFVPASTADVHTIVFWSKNFDPFITGDYGRQLQAYGYHLFFNFSINSESALLEFGLPRLEERLAQLDYLCNHYDPRSINWRFDPVCFYETETHETQDNLKDFSMIAGKAAALGVKRCITSFMDMYPKIKKRLVRQPDLDFVDVPMEKKISVLEDMSRILEHLGISLQTCCERDLLEQIADDLPIGKSACIPNDLIMELFGGRVSLGKDSGQRVRAGCGCMKSMDIGSYSRQPCYHNCLYCYANPCLS
jgi:hypothetical protein